MFDSITKDDLIVAFFPCIYFSVLSQMSVYWSCPNYKNKTTKEATDLILERSHNRELFFALAVKMLAVAKIRGLRLILENPWAEQTFLKANFVMPPTIVDNNRRIRGDYFIKPTAYFFINCKPTYGTSYQKPKIHKTHENTRKSKQTGMCSEERSMISPDYARNFICDFILGKKQNIGQLSLF